MNAPAIEDGAHVFLHVNLCAAVARAATAALVPLRVKLTDRVGGVEFERTVRVGRSDGSQTVVEFDVHRGIYRLRLDAPNTGCAAADYLDFLPDRSRTIVETLTSGPLAASAPVVLLDGTAPLSFLYVKPTFAFFAGGLACNQPVGTPLAVRSTAEYDQGAYHVSLYSDFLRDQPSGAVAGSGGLTASSGPAAGVSPEPAGSRAPSVVVTLRLRTPTGLAHYVRVPIAFPVPWTGWPSHVQFNITEEMIDGLATDKTDTLLCPKLWETRVH